jgi:hypothetical protein
VLGVSLYNCFGCEYGTVSGAESFCLTLNASLRRTFASRLCQQCFNVRFPHLPFKKKKNIFLSIIFTEVQEFDEKSYSHANSDNEK